jgi:flavin-dependent dehydrogenase
MRKLYDVVILGSTPAGLAAASHLAGQGADVAVVSHQSAAVECPLATWVPRDFFKLDELPKGLAKSAGASEFKRVIFHNNGLDKDVPYKSRTTLGRFLAAGELTKALKSAANKAGAKVRGTSTAPAIELSEDRVDVLGTTGVSGRMLLVAQDRPADIIGELSLPVRTVPRSSLVVAGLDVPVNGSAPRELSNALHVAELPERSEIGLFFVQGKTLHVRVVSSSAAAGNRAGELSTLLNGLQQAEIVPGDISLGKATGAVWHPPAGVALELESHVAKRCLLVGTAGGFVETITGHTIYPAVRSALLGADLVLKALNSKKPQDTLMSFKNVWRKALADYLRPPNTSLHMLMPLLFANKRIVPKFTRALLFGQNI